MKDGKGWKRDVHLAKILIAPSLRFIQETGGVKRNPKFTMSWQQHQAYSSTLGSWRPRVRKNNFT